MILAAAGVIACFALYYLVDKVWNGVFVDWFMAHYMMRYTDRDAEGVLHYVWQPAWPAVKQLLFRLDEARTTNSRGGGLGLAIAKDIVALHGGRIWAESENETTTFVVELPLTQGR